ncbi:NUDIX hydrolase [Nocardia callitridis]|uniref:Nudix hydrolase domain-containing protein n=1 Tax=Nocardia callitridis TaxID=648753 RepID=A0ABP9JUI0_9NOCA
MRGDGDGWSRGPDGARHWGRFGAAGLLLRAPLAGGGSAVLLQHRAPWSHQGGTWALPGGARDSDETPVTAAVREAWEETRIRPEDVFVRSERVTATVRGGWTYTTVIADAPTILPTKGNRESTELVWVPEAEVTDRKLHPGFAASWSSLRARPARVVLDDIAEDADVVAALPRTLDLAEAGFVWLHAVLDGPGQEARVIDPVAAQTRKAPERTDELDGSAVRGNGSAEPNGGAGRDAVFSLTRSQLLS